MKPADVWEELAYVSKKSGRELGFASNPLTEMFEEAIEEQKDDFPTKIIVGCKCEPLLMKVLMTAMIKADFEGIKSLRLWNTGIGDIGVKFVCEGLLHLPNIEKLEISGSLMTEKGCEYLGSYLRKISVANVRVLKLDFNKIGSNGVKHIADALAFNTKLVNVSMAHCGICEKGGASLARVISKEGGVKILNVEGNELGNNGIAAFAIGLATNPRLTKLNIADNKFDGSEAHMTALCQGLKGCKTLSSINMDGNLIGDNGLRFMLTHMHKDCTHIYDLDVTCFVDAQLLNMLHEWLNKNIPKKGGKKKGSKGKKKKKK